MKKYVNNSFITKSPSEYKIGTAAVTNLPVTIMTDGQPVSSYTIKGNTQTSGTPSPSSPITIAGCGDKTANLFPTANAGSAENNGITVECDGQGRYHIYGTATDDSSVYFNLNSSIIIPVSVGNGGNGTFSMFNSVYNSSSKISLKFFDGTTYIDNLACTVENRTNTTYTAMANRTINRIRFDVSSGITLDGYINPEVTNNGELPTAFEPSDTYKISILKGLTPLTPMYFSQQLMAIANTKDEYSSSGTATYNTKKYIFTGQETWTYESTYTRFYTEISDFFTQGLRITPFLMTHYPCISDGRALADVPNNSAYTDAISYDDRHRIYIKTDAYTSAADFQAFLAQQYANGTPLIFYYILQDAITETVTAPTITTTGGTATIDVDTTVKPSELDLTYHGWHEHQPLKRENGQWV